jgi:hypothetical protein
MVPDPSRLTQPHPPSSILRDKLDASGLEGGSKGVDCAPAQNITSLNPIDRSIHQETSPLQDDMNLAAVTARLGKSERTMQGYMAAHPVHHFVGRSPRWTETEYQTLRQALDAAERKRRGLPNRTGNASPSPELFVSVKVSPRPKGCGLGDTAGHNYRGADLDRSAS